MATSKIVPYKTMLDMLTNYPNGANLVLNQSTINVYTDYSDTDNTLLGAVKGPIRVQTYGYATIDGKCYVKIYIPADTVENNWDKAMYPWVFVGNDSDDSGVAELEVESDNRNSNYNKNYIKKTKAEFDAIDGSGDITDTKKLVDGGKVDLSKFIDIDSWNENISTMEFDDSNPTIRTEAYTLEDFWINDPTASAEEYNKSIENMNDLSKLRYIFGLPYQFLSTADMRVDAVESSMGNDSTFGITYGEKIASRMPLLYLTPGNSRFLADSTSDERQSAVSNIIDSLFGGNDGNLSDLLDGYSGKLYSIQPAYNEYFNYVNPMCRVGAVLLGLDHLATGQDKRTLADDFDSEAEYDEYRKLDGVACCDYNWAYADNSGEDSLYTGESETNTPFEKVVSLADQVSDAVSWLYYKQVIPFYITSEHQFTDNFSNETTESSLASKINGFSDAAREMQFIMGTTQSIIAENWDALGDVFANSRRAIDEFSSKLAGNGNIFSSLLGNLKTVATGGRLMFPNIWSNSSYNKSYQINIKLTTPYYDVKSWWLNIYVPLCHLIALVLPRGEYHNGYSAPFLVKAFYKGSFNIDMGIITEMTVNKGKEGGWTKDGLPTVVDVSFTIQDLYSTISMSPITLAKSNMLENIQELDYLCSLCGVNINEPELSRIVKLYAALNVTSKWTDIPFQLTANVTQKFTSKVSSIFSLL